MSNALSATTAPLRAGMSEPARVVARKMYCVLVPSLHGQALCVAHSVERNNGFPVWRVVREEDEPAVHTSMLS